MLEKRLTFASVPFDEINAAIKLLNTPKKPEPRKVCHQGSRLNPSRNKYQIPHKSLLHILALIKNAILREEWNLVLRLLLKFIDEPRKEQLTMSAFIKYTMIFILNDPQAKSMATLHKFLQIVMECESAADQFNMMRKILTLIKIKRK